MMFAVAHEYAHVLLRHLSPARTTRISTEVGAIDVAARSREQEHEADDLATQLLLTCTMQHLLLVADRQSFNDFLRLIHLVGGPLLLLALAQLPTGAARVRRHADVLASAPVMPMRLIAPVSITAPGPAAGDVSWGVEAVGAATSPFSGEGVVVAVLDSGIDASHAAFAGVTLGKRDFTGAAHLGDEHGHGTHCAATIFGRDVDGRRIGVARGVQRALTSRPPGPAEGWSL
jgi:subtilisin family serine protease